jgi:hypothetical protein
MNLGYKQTINRFINQRAAGPGPFLRGWMPSDCQRKIKRKMAAMRHLEEYMRYPVNLAPDGEGGGSFVSA